MRLYLNNEKRQLREGSRVEGSLSFMRTYRTRSHESNQHYGQKNRQNQLSASSRSTEGSKEWIPRKKSVFLVSNASFRTTTGESLNDVLLTELWMMLSIASLHVLHGHHQDVPADS